MAHFGALKIPKSQKPDKTPYTIYYPHTRATSERNWDDKYVQYVSIDPAAKKNYAFRIERRYKNGWITPIAFDKTHIECIDTDGEGRNAITICNTFQKLTEFLDKFSEFYDDCHYIIIERQLPQNYRATRVAQHTISYFSIKLHNKGNLPSIVEVDSKLKGRILKAPKNLTDKQLKTWAIEIARDLLKTREDTFSLKVLDKYRNKQDDLSDTIVQAEAIFILWGYKPTESPPSLSTKKAKVSKINNLKISNNTEDSAKIIKLNFNADQKDKNDDISKRPFKLNFKSNDVLMDEEFEIKESRPDIKNITNLNNLPDRTKIQK